MHHIYTLLFLLFTGPCQVQLLLSVTEFHSSARNWNGLHTRLAAGHLGDGKGQHAILHLCLQLVNLNSTLVFQHYLPVGLHTGGYGKEQLKMSSLFRECLHTEPPHVFTQKRMSTIHIRSSTILFKKNHRYHNVQETNRSQLTLTIHEQAQQEYFSVFRFMKSQFSTPESAASQRSSSKRILQHHAAVALFTQVFNASISTVFSSINLPRW